MFTVKHNRTNMQSNRDKLSGFQSEFWGICCESGKKYSQIVKKKFHLSMAALDPLVSGTSKYVSLMVERGGCQYLLCTLMPGSILQVELNLFFERGENVTFSLKGKGTVHLSGYHIFHATDPPVSNQSKSPVQSPLKNNIQNIDIDEGSSFESDSIASLDSSNEERKMKDVRKTLQMQSSHLDGESSEESSDEGETFPKKLASSASITAKKPPTPQGTPNKKNAVIKSPTKFTPKESIKDLKRPMEVDSSDEDEESSSDEAPPKQKPKDFPSSKKLKTATSTPVVGKKTMKQNTPNKLFAELIDLEDAAAKTTPKSLKKGDMDSSIGRTPMPKKPVPKVPVEDGESSDDASDEMEASVGNKSMQSSTEQLNASTESKKKRKKKKKKAAANDSQVSENTPAKLDNSSSAMKSAKKLPGGLEYEDIRVGHGLEARKGKLVHVYYTGKLENNKVFDSRQQGSKPFSFKLGAGQVIRGWDVGLEGMKVGGKRKLKIPPHLAYKNQRMGDIPPSSTLHFVVELKAVS